MDKVTEARLALSSLTLYRKIFSDKTVADFSRLLEASKGVDLRSFADAYGEFFSSLADSDELLQFSSYLEELVKYDDNAFARKAAEQGACAEDQPDDGENSSEKPEEESALLQAARRDLDALCKAASVTAADIKAAAKENFDGVDGAAEFIVGLPIFETGKNLFSDGPEAAYKRILKFYAKYGFGLYARYDAFFWRGGSHPALTGILHTDPVTFAELPEHERENQAVSSNTSALMSGKQAKNLLFAGGYGSGDSRIIKAAFNRFREEGLRIIEVPGEYVRDLPQIIQAIRDVPLKFILFLQDIRTDIDAAAALAEVLRKGLAEKPGNFVVYALCGGLHASDASPLPGLFDQTFFGDTREP